MLFHAWILHFSLPWWYVWTQGLAFARQALYHFSHIPHPQPPALSAVAIFQIGSHAFLPRLILNWSPSTYTSHIAGMTGRCHCAWLIPPHRVLILHLFLLRNNILMFAVTRFYLCIHQVTDTQSKKKPLRKKKKTGHSGTYNPKI
jgi:hypothetical protein